MCHLVCYIVTVPNQILDSIISLHLPFSYYQLKSGRLNAHVASTPSELFSADFLPPYACMIILLTKSPYLCLCQISFQTFQPTKNIFDTMIIIVLAFRPPCLSGGWNIIQQKSISNVTKIVMTKVASTILPID